MKYFLLTFIVILFSCSKQSSKMDLSGQWTVKLDSANVGINEHWAGNLYETTINLPGTTDDAGLGYKDTLKPELRKPQLTHLTRKYKYVGPVWYSREISVPESWSGKKVKLNMERVIWSTNVWVDSVKVEGQQESLTTPHYYDLTEYVTPGKKHILTVRVDNSYLHDISVADNLAHAYTDHTQIKWNGIIGDISLESCDMIGIDNMQVFPDVDRQTVKVVVCLDNSSDMPLDTKLNLSVYDSKGNSVASLSDNIVVENGKGQVEYNCQLDSVSLWSEHNPELYRMKAEIVSGDMSDNDEVSFGMRKLENVGSQMMLNGKPLFLRGTLECCIFPLTGTPPMDKEGWKKVFTAAKEYGLNHLRFHSWCPPTAAFEVADEMGFYLQVELPVWSTNLGTDPGAVEFLHNESERIIREYGNHPSFCLWSLGNELEGDFEMLTNLMLDLKKKDARHLYTTTSFTFQKGHGAWPEANDDFFVTQWTNKGWVRGQGVFNQYPPSFNNDYVSAIEGMTVPLITHEIGQYSVYPDMTEIPKYTGVLKPLNFIAVKNDLEKKGLLDKAADYTLASGKLAAILYKEEIERALKTEGISGFQLLDLHDFPGQGTALVGLLNAFWESKGIISGKDFREFCSPVVPLLRFPKAVYTNNESFVADIELCNYGNEDLTDKTLNWSVNVDGKVIAGESVKVRNAVIGYNDSLGVINCPLDKINSAKKVEVVLEIEGTEYRNRWNIWVYPQSIDVEYGKVAYTRNFDEAERLLSEGRTVLFNPDWKQIKGIEGKFVPVFWSPVHFPKQAGTMGVLCNPSHKALEMFPTDMHTDWQWWDLNINSTTLVVDSLKGGNAIVEMIDNFANNRRLASLIEGKVGNGKIMIATFDLNTDMGNRPVARQMLASILKYMNGNDFNPETIENLDVLAQYFGHGTGKKESATGIYE